MAKIDYYLQGVRREREVPGPQKIVSGIRAPGSDKRADAFPESPKPIAERDSRK